MTEMAEVDHRRKEIQAFLLLLLMVIVESW